MPKSTKPNLFKFNKPHHTNLKSFMLSSNPTTVLTNEDQIVKELR